MKNKKGFTLIELLIVIAIIGLLATTLAPKLREQLAKGKDAKAIALLGASRTATELVLIEKIIRGNVDSNGNVAIKLSDIKSKLDNRSNEIFENEAYIPIGGSRETSKGEITYGGKLIFSKNNANWTEDTFTSDDDVVYYTGKTEEAHPSRQAENLYFALPIQSGGYKNFSTEGKNWRYDY